MPADRPTADLNSPTFTFGQNYQIQSDTFTEASTTMADQYEAVLASALGTSCSEANLKAQIAASLQSGQSLTSVTVRREGAAQSGTGSQLLFYGTLNVSGQTVPFDGIVSSFNVGRLVVETVEQVVNLKVVDEVTLNQVTKAAFERAEAYKP